MNDTLADRYGGVLVSGGGKVLLREPTGHFGDSVWTYAKGSPDPGESPRETALREVREETGYSARILAPIPGRFGGTTSTTAFYLMDAGHPPAAFCTETASLRWVSFEEARGLIAQTTTQTGRQRDLAVLDAAERVLQGIPFPRHPNVQPEDYWLPLQDMPPRQALLAWTRTFSAAELDKLRRGFFPTVMEQKWFIHVAGTRLRLHRSWTGVLIYDIGLAEQADGGAVVTDVIVNREPEQYGQTDDAADVALLDELIEHHLLQRPDTAPVDGFVTAIDLASQPNYLGSAAVVSALLGQVLEARVNVARGAADEATWQTVIADVTYAFCADPEFTRRPGWHSVAQLGQTLIRCLGLNADACAGQDLTFIVRTGLAALGVQIGVLLEGFSTDPAAQWSPHALEQLNALHSFAASVFLGTHTLGFADRTLNDFTWQAVAAQTEQ